MLGSLATVMTHKGETREVLPVHPDFVIVLCRSSCLCCQY